MDNIFRWIQKLITHWVKPAAPNLIIGILSDSTRNRADLVVENAVLRQHRQNY